MSPAVGKESLLLRAGHKIVDPKTMNLKTNLTLVNMEIAGRSLYEMITEISAIKQVDFVIDGKYDTIMLIAARHFVLAGYSVNVHEVRQASNSEAARKEHLQFFMNAASALQPYKVDGDEVVLVTASPSIPFSRAAYTRIVSLDCSSKSGSMVVIDSSMLPQLARALHQGHPKSSLFLLNCGLLSPQVLGLFERPSHSHIKLLPYFQ